VLLLFAPPGSAKSTYVSVLLPSWYLANHPTKSILAATHSVEFAERWGRRVRNDIAHETKTLGMSLPEIANQPRDGALQAGASTIALALASAFLAFGLTLVWATISSEVVRTLTQDGKAEALGLVSRRLLGAP